MIVTTKVSFDEETKKGELSIKTRASQSSISISSSALHTHRYVSLEINKIVFVTYENDSKEHIINKFAIDCEGNYTRKLHQ